jgi:hypothetical protein
MENSNPSSTTHFLNYLKSISKSGQPEKKESTVQSLEDFKKKEDKLKDVEQCLKKEFVGIDSQIERVINLIRPWYLMPKAIRKPIVIGLWGMTGVGKTSLVTRLVHHLGFEEHFFAEDLGKYTGDDINLQQKIHYSAMPRLSGHPSILMLDEIHNVRTIDQFGVELDRSAMRDFWQLLDTGFISRDMERYQEMIMMLQTECSYIPPGIDPSELDKYLKDRLEMTLSSYTLDKIVVQLELPISATQLQKVVSADIKAFAEWLITEYQWFYKYAKTLDFRKCIIFVAGNLDEVFADSHRLNPEDLTANELYEKTTQIGIDTVKECLLRRFKPEQVARLGGSLLVFPSLSRDSVIRLLENHLNTLTEFYKNEFDWNISFDDSIKELIFREGTIAAQGARIVLSTLSDMIESRLPTWLIHCLQKEVKKISVRFSAKKKEFELVDVAKSKVIHTDAVTLREDRLPEITLSDAHRNVLAIHEAGHAVVGVACFGLLPIKLLAGSTSWHRGGPRVVFPQTNLKTKETLYQHIHVCFGGRIAEELVFGEDKVTSGSVEDINMATQMASYMMTQLSMGTHIGTSAIDPTSPFALTTFKPEDDKQCEQILKAAYAQTKKIVREQWPLLMAISEKLQTSDKLTVLDFAELVKKHYQGTREEIEKIIVRKEPRSFESLIIPTAPRRSA